MVAQFSKIVVGAFFVASLPFSFNFSALNFEASIHRSAALASSPLWGACESIFVNAVVVALGNPMYRRNLANIDHRQQLAKIISEVTALPPEERSDALASRLSETPDLRGYIRIQDNRNAGAQELFLNRRYNLAWRWAEVVGATTSVRRFSLWSGHQAVLLNRDGSLRFYPMGYWLTRPVRESSSNLQFTHAIRLLYEDPSHPFLKLIDELEGRLLSSPNLFSTYHLQTWLMTALVALQKNPGSWEEFGSELIAALDIADEISHDRSLRLVMSVETGVFKSDQALPASFDIEVYREDRGYFGRPRYSSYMYDLGLIQSYEVKKIGKVVTKARDLRSQLASAAKKAAKKFAYKEKEGRTTLILQVNLNPTQNGLLDQIKDYVAKNRISNFELFDEVILTDHQGNEITRVELSQAEQKMNPSPH